MRIGLGLFIGNSQKAGPPADVTAPTVVTFTVTTPSSALAIPITAFTASEAGVYFIVTESSTPPAVDAAGWNLTAPTTYTVADLGAYTLYPWVKDAAGNISSVFGSPRAVSVVYDVDFTGMSNGALPAPLNGSTWAIASGKAINSPTYGSELLTDPSLEATYTAGKCNTLTKGGSPTLAESADVHAGSKAQEFTGTINNDSLEFPTFGGATGKWLQFSGWGKRTAGTGGRSRILKAINGFPGGFIRQRTIKDAAYTQKIMVFKAYSATVEVYPAACGITPFDTVIVDDFSMKEIPAAEMYATRSYPSADAITRVYIDQTGNNGTVGIVARLGSTSNPQNYILVGIDTMGDSSTGVELTYLSMAKVVAGTLTVLIAPTSLGALVVNGDYIEVVCSGTSVSMFYNGVQKGTTQTVSDAGIVSNTIFGFFGAGGSVVNRFFLGAAA